MATFDFRRANHLTQLTMAQADVLPKSPKKNGPPCRRKEATKEHFFDAVFDEAASGFMA